MIDTHCHLDIEAFDADRAEVLARAAAAGVQAVVIPAIRPRTWDALIALAAELGAVPEGPVIGIGIGVHPQVVDALDPDERALLRSPEAALHAACDRAEAALASGRARLVAIGECGLDGGTGFPNHQARLLAAHREVAAARGLPMIVHVLRAHDRAPTLLAGATPVTGVMHSYSGGADLVPTYQRLGLHLSFAGPVTFPGARRPVEAARAVAANWLLAETDAPDQAPAPHRGGRCEPAHLAAVIDGLAMARGVPVAQLRAQVHANACRLFPRLGLANPAEPYYTDGP